MHEIFMLYISWKIVPSILKLENWFSDATFIFILFYFIIPCMTKLFSPLFRELFFLFLGSFSFIFLVLFSHYCFSSISLTNLFLLSYDNHNRSTCSYYLLFPLFHDYLGRRTRRRKRRSMGTCLKSTAQMSHTPRNRYGHIIYYIMYYVMSCHLMFLLNYYV